MARLAATLPARRLAVGPDPGRGRRRARADPRRGRRMSADLSVIVPVRDGAATLGAALRSIAAPRRGPGRDRRRRRRLARRQRRARRGVRRARARPAARGARRRSGPQRRASPRRAGALLGFLDADDEWLAAAPDPRRALLAAEPDAIALGGVCVRDGERERTGPLWLVRRRAHAPRDVRARRPDRRGAARRGRGPRLVPARARGGRRAASHAGAGRCATCAARARSPPTRPRAAHGPAPRPSAVAPEASP